MQDKGNNKNITTAMMRENGDSANAQKTGRYLFLVEPFHCDFNKRLFMGHLGNHLLNAADFHSNDRGFGMNYLNTIQKTWVLSRLAIEMKEMPVAYTQLAVETWVESVMRFFTNRNFRISDAETGKIYGYGKSVWAMIDTQTRQPVDLLKIRDGDILKYVETQEQCPIEQASRVKIGDNTQLVETLKTHYSDVDINGHINSVKYIEHLFDIMDETWHRENNINRIDVAYVAESHFGDVLNFWRENAGENQDAFRIVKQTADGKDEEACRVKIKYEKEIKTAIHS